MNHKQFSKRQGYGANKKEIKIWEDAPEGLRYIALNSATELGCGPGTLRELICKELHKAPNLDNFSAYPNIWHEVQTLTYECKWFKVYDLIEVFYRQLLNSEGQLNARKFETTINDYLIEEGIGWQLQDGNIINRGAETFEREVSTATLELKESGRNTAALRIKESLNALSRRPEADLAGAISHAIAALECIATDIVGNPKATLGDVLKDQNQIFGSLKKTIEGIWGYACNEGARHGKEGREPAREEAELIVGVAASAVVYLNRKYAKGG